MIFRITNIHYRYGLAAATICIPPIPRTRMDTFPRHLPGIALALAIGLAGMALAQVPALAELRFSALTLAIVAGMLIGNLPRVHLPAAFAPGIALAQRNLLRAGIVLYGLRISFQQIAGLGPGALLLDALIVAGTIAIAVWVGRRVLGLDRDTAILTGFGSGICGAAAVLAAERMLKPDPGKVAIAVAGVVLFGTIDIFLYPQLARVLGLAPHAYGVYTGATVHEVAQVVAAGSAVSPVAADTAVVVKLTRVLMLVPALVVLGFWQARRGDGGGRITVPWFAFGFAGVCVVNSLMTLPHALRSALLDVDTLLLATAMGALGVETRVARLRALGPRPLLLALILFAWLTLGGYWLMRVLA